MAGVLQEAGTAYSTSIMCLLVLNSVLWCLLRFKSGNDVRFFFTSNCL